MKKILLACVFMLCSFLAYSQSYLGHVTKQVNFRQGPSIDYGVISTLPAGTMLFIISLETNNDFYNVIDIENDKEGYVHKAFIELGDLVGENQSGVFVPTGSSSKFDPEIEIFNNTSRSLTLKLNNTIHSFMPYEKKLLTFSAGLCYYRASAPGVVPNIGTETMENNKAYKWEFFIIGR
jgi:hypothetical protein